MFRYRTLTFCLWPILSIASLGRSSSTVAAAGTAGSTPSAPFNGTPNLLAEAKESLQEGNFDSAIQKFQTILHATPNVPDASNGLARTYLKLDRVQDAYEAVTNGIKIVDVPSERVTLGEVYFRQGKILEAEKEFVSVINGGLPDARAYLGLARVRRALSMYKSEKAMLDKAHELDPDDPDIWIQWINTLSASTRIKNLEEYLAAKNDDDAEERARQQRELDYLRAREKGPKGSCHLTSTTTSTETPLVMLLSDPKHLRGLGLSVTVNGKKSTLMLDTGASGILIDRGMADKAGVTKISETKIGGIGDRGDNSGYVALADSLKIGDLEFKNCPVQVLEKRSVMGDDGLIGADVFEEFLVDIDFPTRKLGLKQLPQRPQEAAHPVVLQSNPEGSESPDPSVDKLKEPDNSLQDRYIAPEMNSYTRIFRFGHVLLIPTQVDQIPRKLFLIDTGSFMDNISVPAAREVTKVHGDPDMIVTGLSGRVKNVYRANKAMLQFGHLRQPAEDLTALDFSALSRSIGTEVSGTLGFTTLNQLNMKIDYRDGLVDFIYKPGR